MQFVFGNGFNVEGKLRSIFDGFDMRGSEVGYTVCPPLKTFSPSRLLSMPVRRRVIVSSHLVHSDMTGDFVLAWVIFKATRDRHRHYVPLTSDMMTIDFELGSSSKRLLIEFIMFLYIYHS